MLNESRNFVTALTLAAALLGVDRPARAQVVETPTLAGLSAELTKKVAALPRLNEIMSTATDANISLNKQKQAYTDDQAQKSAWANAAIKHEEEVTRVNMAKSYNEEIDSYNSKCASGGLNKAQYDSCTTWSNQLDAKSKEVDDAWERYKAVWNRENIDPINEVIKKQNARIVELDAKIEKNFTAFTEAQDRSIALRKRIKAIEATFRNACSSAPKAGPFTKAETLKWCNSVNWDGASTHLVPMYKYQGTGGASSGGTMRTTP